MRSIWKRLLRHLSGPALCVLVLAVLTAGAGCRRQIVVRTAGDLSKERQTERPAGTEAQEADRPAHPEAEDSDRPAGAEAQEADRPSDQETVETGNDDSDNAEEDLIYVHVSGMVRVPGVYALHSGDRVFHAVEAAGGFLPEADRDWCNLAEVLADADKLRIYSTAETAAMEEAGKTPSDDDFGIIRCRDRQGTGAEGAVSGTAAGQDTGIVNLNTAGVEELMTLPGIGQKRAEDIVAYRQMNGGFSSVEELTNISGIGNSMLAKLNGRITV